MDHPFKYKRVLLKLSGEALVGDGEYGIDGDTLDRYAQHIAELHKMGIEIAVVVGGGNIFRGIQGQKSGMGRAHADYMGMLPTLNNGMALQDALEKAGATVRLQSAIGMEKICEPYIRRKAVRHLEKGRVVIFAARTGNPFFTTDTAASLRAIEIDAELVLKGTRVDGVYNADPEKDINAIKFDEISFADVLRDRLKVMDMTAFTLCQENELPIIIFNINEPENLKRIVMGENVGTLVS